jgi:hypothetical protein
MAWDMSYAALDLARQVAAAFGQAAASPRWTPPERETLEAAQRAIWQARDVVLNDLDRPTRPQGKRAKASRAMVELNGKLRSASVRKPATQIQAAFVPPREWLLPANAKKARARERAQLLAAARAGLAERAS